MLVLVRHVELAKKKHGVCFYLVHESFVPQKDLGDVRYVLNNTFVRDPTKATLQNVMSRVFPQALQFPGERSVCFMPWKVPPYF